MESNENQSAIGAFHIFVFQGFILLSSVPLTDFYLLLEYHVNILFILYF